MFHTYSDHKNLASVQIETDGMRSHVESIPKINLKDDALKETINKVTNPATSGNLFLGEVIRQFPESKIRFKGKISDLGDDIGVGTVDQSQMSVSKFDCRKWAVMTTIFEPPSEAVRRFLYRRKWCVVVVGDKGKPGEVRY